MTELVLLEGREGGPGPGGLFHTPRFFGLHAGAGSAYFRGVLGSDIRASVHFTDVGDGVWRSPARGTYAGWAWAGDLPLEDLGGFMADVEDRLAERGVRSLEMLLPPMAHDPHAFTLAVYLMQGRGWVTTREDLNSHLDVDGRPLEARMSRGNAKRLRQCAREGLVASALRSDELPAAHETLALNRAAGGVTLSMSLAQLEEMQSAFPDDLLLFGVRGGAALAAAAVCLRLSRSVIYVFAWGHRPEYASLSPVVPLAELVYSYCQTSGVGLLDLGTSTLGQVQNPGLLRFKRGLGATESLKTRLRKDLT